MKIQLLGSKIEIPEGLKTFTEKKFLSLSKQLKRYEKDGGDLLLHVEIARTTRHHKKGEIYYIEATLHLPGKTLRIEHHDEEVRKGITQAKNRMKELIGEYTDREQEVDQKKIRSKKSTS